MNIRDEIKGNGKRISQICEEIETLSFFDDLLSGIDLADVAYLSVCNYGKPSISLTLSEEHRNSKLAHKIARRFHVIFTKTKSYWGESLDMTASTDEWAIGINGAVPSTCHIVEHEEPMTAEEIETAQQKALANVKTVKVTREIVCK